MHVPCVGSDIFGALFFAKGNWQLQYRVQYTSEGLLLEMKAKGFLISPCSLDVILNETSDLQSLCHTSRSSLSSAFEASFLVLLSSLLLFIRQSSTVPMKTSASLLRFPRFSGSPSFLIHLFFPSAVHFTSTLRSFLIHRSFLCGPFISLSVPSPFPAQPSHMLLSSLGAETASLAGLGNGAQRAPY